MRSSWLSPVLKSLQVFLTYRQLWSARLQQVDHVQAALVAVVQASLADTVVATAAVAVLAN
jgi:hypothetical protein